MDGLNISGFKTLNRRGGLTIYGLLMSQFKEEKKKGMVGSLTVDEYSGEKIVKKR